MPEKQLCPDIMDTGCSVLIQRNTTDITLCVFVYVYVLNSLIREQLITIQSCSPEEKCAVTWTSVANVFAFFLSSAAWKHRKLMLQVVI